jgi:ABC-2 type transport system ATP-binding protein
MIELIELTKKFKDRYAVDHINLSVRPGTIFAFLGPNGAGKTTTIKLMAGTLKPTSGHIVLNGLDLGQYPEAAKQAVGVIPDRPFLYEKLTGLEFLRFVASLYRMDRSPALEARISELLSLFDLNHRKEELIGSYSHGMKQRLVMCAALLHQPKILIIDEPMVGLDPKGVRLVKDILKEEAAQGTTIFMSTHSLEVAEELSDEIAIILDGRLIAQGSAEALRRQANVDGNLEEIFLKLVEEKT